MKSILNVTQLHHFLLMWIIAASIQSICVAQQVVRKPPRTPPPKFNARDFEGIFFEDIQKHLVGSLPIEDPLHASGENKTANDPAGNSIEAMASEASSEGGEGNVWKSRISGTSVEDLVKESKRRLDSIVTTPAKFSGGGFKDARREFTLLGTLFTIIELYPESIRWQASASVARSRFSRMAANAKVGSAPSFNEAKLRVEDLNTLLKGTPINDSLPKNEIVWPDIADRVPSMQLLEWSLRDNLNGKVASEDAFTDGSEEVVKYAELVAAIGETLLQPGMTDADDDEYKKHALKMIDEAAKVVQSVKLNNPTMAREGVGQIDQACNACHSSYR